MQQMQKDFWNGKIWREIKRNKEDRIKKVDVMPEDKLFKRYEILDKLIELLSHGTAKIEWTERTIIKVEEIDSKDSKIIK